VSIVAYTGLPGSGKSYSVVEHQILPALRSGRTVVTNLAMDKAAVEALAAPGELVEFSLEVIIADPSRLYDFVKPGVVLVIDECWKIWPQGMSADKVPEEYKRLLAEHRHMVDAHNNSTQIVLVVQDLANIAAFARRLVENTFVSHKLGYLGMNKSYRVDIYYGGVTGCTPNVNKRLRFLAGRYKKEIYALYKSQTMSEASAGYGDEAKVDGRANMLKRPVFIVGLIAAPLAIGWGLYRFNGAFKSMSSPSKGLVSMHHEPEAPGTAQRSGADSAPGALARVKAIVEGSPRLLVYLGGVASSGIIGADSRTYVVDGHRCLVEVRLKASVPRCQFRGAWYDALGVVGGDFEAPVGAYSAGK
jgi:zona occludens toxin (predicted ATPase)